MVHRSLQKMHQNSQEWARRISEEITALRVKNLARITSSQAIKEICNEVISAVDGILIVHVDEEELSKRKPRRADKIRIQHTDDTRWANTSIIRDDWSSKEWGNKSLKWWVWYNKDESILGCMYYKPNKEGYEVFIKKDIADHPEGAIFLIQEMKKKLNKHIPRK